MSTPVTIFTKGQLVEGYRVLGEVGTGAASRIYLVQDPKTKQIWALKHVERHEHKDARFLEQAVIEGEICEQFEHPAIRRVVRVIKRKKLMALTDVFLVMEFVDGVSMEREPPREDQELAVHVFSQVAQAMAYMHSLGYVHADMKPNNVMVLDDGHAKIIDFGQSCKNGTVKPRIQGTPDYIAPEQVHRRPITPRTDVYNLGATMYWVMSGQNIPTALAKGDSLVSRLDDNLVPRPKPIMDLNPRLHPRLAQLIMQCVEPDPDRRPETMTWLADQLLLVLGILRARGGGRGAARPGSKGGPALAGAAGPRADSKDEDD